MASPQEFPVAPPQQQDRELLQDFSEVVQRNIASLFELSHRHSIRTEVPKVGDLEPGVPVVVNLSGTFYIYVRVNGTQLARVALTVV